MYELKPCPFCGNEYISVVPSVDKRFYWCKCEECKVSTRCFNDKQEAIDFWNRRATERSDYWDVTCDPEYRESHFQKNEWGEW